ncbi:MAG: thiamine-phosphate kinase [Alcaligenaceae bacterium]|nr:thiamine-phosphate kinase [Alcaligenaceae bacterium]
MDEFALIRQYFTNNTASVTESSSFVGIGDDCAVLDASQGDLVVCKDILIEGRHFFADVDPFLLGHKALAVNLSDLAAMGAKPLACLMGIALPKADPQWLKPFSQGFKALAECFDCALVGGDTTRSEQGIFISVTALGLAEQPHVLRSNAQVGDDIWVSGELGAPKVALELLLLQQQRSLNHAELSLLKATRRRLEQPEPQVTLGLLLKPYVHAMIDISDGLLQDLSHILKASQVGAIVYEEQIPIDGALLDSEVLNPEQRSQAVLAGGDEYQLCFTASLNNRSYIEQLALSSGTKLRRIGKIIAESDLVLLDSKHKVIENLPQGFNHFA